MAKGLRITVAAETRLERAVKTWINRQAGEYDSGAAGVLQDLAHGCSSGIVSELVYTRDCVKFFQRHRRDISALLAEILDDTGSRVDELFSNPRSMQWEKNDPTAQEDNNRNILAWFGFEEAARKLADRQGIEA